MVIGARTCPLNQCHMGMIAEAVAEKWGITRQQQDELALESHRRAQVALERGRFKSQIVPIESKKKDRHIIDTDEHVRFDARPLDMSKLKPAFKRDGGSVTASNASGINDAAAPVVLMERGEAERRGLKPLAKLVGYA